MLSTLSAQSQSHLLSAFGSKAVLQEFLAALDAPLVSGSVFWVNSAHPSASNSNPGTSRNAPLSTIVEALAKCTANAGDLIIVGNGHTETISAAGYITAVAGVTILGLGNGANRPTLSFSTTGSTIAVSAANFTMKNFRVTSTVDEMVKMFNITAADCTLDKVDHFETTSCQTIQFALTTNAADRLTIRNCQHYQGTAAGSAQKWIQLVGVDDCLIEDNVFHLTLNNAAGSCTISGSTALVRGVIRRNTIVQLGGTTQVSAILLVDNSTSFVHDNRCAAGTTALAGIVDVGSTGYAAENYALNTGDKSGLLDPGVDS